MTLHATSSDFALDAAQKYVKAAVYFPGMDYLDYARNDGVKIFERVDDFLTVIWNENDEMIGFKLKGIRNFFLTKLKPVLNLQDDDFVLVRDIFLALATALGEKVFSDVNRHEPRVVQYRQALKIATDDNVKIAPRDYEPMAA